MPREPCLRCKGTGARLSGFCGGCEAAILERARTSALFEAQVRPPRRAVEEDWVYCRHCGCDELSDPPLCSLCRAGEALWNLLRRADWWTGVTRRVVLLLIQICLRSVRQVTRGEGPPNLLFQ